MKWNVFYSDWNGKKIKTYNIFDHYGFRDDCNKAWKEYKNDFDKFEKKVRDSLLYYFWAKCEWEIIISPFPPNDKIKESKIDVYQQVMLNWNVFIKELWNELFINNTILKEEEKYNV